MKINLQKITNTSVALNKLMYFKQFNLCDTIKYKSFVYVKKYHMDKYFWVKEKVEIYDLDYTCPTIKVNTTKIIDTLEATSLEGQHLSGKKLIIVGEICFKLVIYYSYGECKGKYGVKDMEIPFSTFIIVPKDICDHNVVNIRYLIEDVSIAQLDKEVIIISVTPLMQYVDEYLYNPCCDK